MRGETRSFLEAAGLDEMSAELVDLALDEACANIIRHAYAGCGERPIRLIMECANKTLRFILRDFGEPCDPGKIQGRELEDFRPGGLGIPIIHTAFDEVEFVPCKKGTRLTLVKRIAVDPASKPDQ